MASSSSSAITTSTTHTIRIDPRAGHPLWTRVLLYCTPTLVEIYPAVRNPLNDTRADPYVDGGCLWLAPHEVGVFRPRWRRALCYLCDKLYARFYTVRPNFAGVPCLAEIASAEVSWAELSRRTAHGVVHLTARATTATPPFSPFEVDMHIAGDLFPMGDVRSHTAHVATSMRFDTLLLQRPMRTVELVKSIPTHVGGDSMMFADYISPAGLVTPTDRDFYPVEAYLLTPQQQTSSAFWDHIARLMDARTERRGEAALYAKVEPRELRNAIYGARLIAFVAQYIEYIADRIDGAGRGSGALEHFADGLVTFFGDCEDGSHAAMQLFYSFVGCTFIVREDGTERPSSDRVEGARQALAKHYSPTIALMGVSSSRASRRAFSAGGGGGGGGGEGEDMEPRTDAAHAVCALIERGLLTHTVGTHRCCSPYVPLIVDTTGMVEPYGITPTSNAVRAAALIEYSRTPHPFDDTRHMLFSPRGSPSPFYSYVFEVLSRDDLLGAAGVGVFHLMRGGGGGGGGGGRRGATFEAFRSWSLGAIGGVTVRPQPGRFAKPEIAQMARYAAREPPTHPMYPPTTAGGVSTVCAGIEAMLKRDFSVMPLCSKIHTTVRFYMRTEQLALETTQAALRTMYAWERMVGISWYREHITDGLVGYEIVLDFAAPPPI